MSITRSDGRSWDELRPITITPSFQLSADGSALIETGNTKVLCAASVEEQVPPFLKGSGKGWVTAEYDMLPRATSTRSTRDRNSGRINGRSQEIQRLIGRSLRAIIDLGMLGERTIHIDCDVLQADGGTRTAAITGAYVALTQATNDILKTGKIPHSPILSQVAATSIGIIGEQLLLDLCYEEDFNADIDFNVVLNNQGKLIELQGATEAHPFDRKYIAEILSLAFKGSERLFRAQTDALTQ
ncbi:MAG: ribonuclease PH [Dehalococcoidia bacterium]|nr:ribonuclease PH [Dehalococcoidia bacterium]|tara:strand:+ start:15425 stop:16150 length:726 start_codon:yes stop_codon:yes gene_type:complete